LQWLFEAKKRYGICILDFRDIHFSKEIKMSIKKLIDRIVSDGRLTLREHKLLLKKIHEDGNIDEEENEQLTRVLEMIKKGELKIV